MQCNAIYNIDGSRLEYDGFSAVHIFNWLVNRGYPFHTLLDYEMDHPTLPKVCLLLLSTTKHVCRVFVPSEFQVH